jgi:VanZ family protein
VIGHRTLNTLAWGVLALYVATLLTLTHLPKPPSVFIERASDKTLHFLAYGTLSILTYAACAIHWPARRRLAAWVLVACMVFAVIDESTQPLFNRHADVKDYLFDVIGICCGLMVALVTRHFVSKPAASGGANTHQA